MPEGGFCRSTVWLNEKLGHFYFTTTLPFTIKVHKRYWEKSHSIRSEKQRAISKEEGWRWSGMDQAFSPLYAQGGNDGCPRAVHPGSIQLHPQVQNQHKQPVVIVQPSADMRQYPPAEPVPDYMCYSRFSTLCCCLCLGLCALQFSRAVSFHLFSFDCIFPVFVAVRFCILSKLDKDTPVCGQ